MKRFTCILLIFTLILICTAAQAGNSPASQFGFQGWPYLQESPCHPECIHCSENPNCIHCPYCQDAMATARPQPQMTPAPIQTVQPTARPTMQPSLPTMAPTTRPTTKPTATPSASNGDYTTISGTVQEQKALNLLNADRIANGLTPLSLDPELSRIARIKSQDMKDNNYFAHNSPTYGSASDMLKAFGYAFHGVGENIAHHATVEKSQAAFMSSAGHRQNILGSQWQKVGIGVVYDAQGFVYVTQLFVR